MNAFYFCPVTNKEDKCYANIEPARTFSFSKSTINFRPAKKN